ncbi:MAG: MBL fold metallo-hydrolase [Candidatus Accumulibacter sp.]|jgi:glyoxylase-like metal-dependent hydrolase (beta-lactamase superfamily II)|nr:MBL fold metallo-hydrolase [Accumulibacter sp.]
MSLRLLSGICILVLLLLAGGRSALAGKDPFGSWEITLISDGEAEGSSDLFVGADEALVKKYLPNGTYPTAIQYFLLRMPDKKTLLVDTGFGKKLLPGLHALGLTPENIDAVLLTHMHSDHIGGMLTEGRPTFPRAKVYLAEPERAYWTDPALTAQASPRGKEGFLNAQKVLAAYGKQVQTFEPGELEARGVELLPGVRAVAAFGHTPGHTMYLLGEGDRQLLIWGDLTHALAMQMPVPRTAMVYDVDPEKAVATRLKVLRYVSERQLPVAGMHIPAAGMGRVCDDGKGGYVFIPPRTSTGCDQGAPSETPPKESSPAPRG